MHRKMCPNHGNIVNIYIYILVALTYLSILHNLIYLASLQLIILINLKYSVKPNKEVGIVDIATKNS